jgi:hypothetical protein
MQMFYDIYPFFMGDSRPVSPSGQRLKQFACLASYQAVMSENEAPGDNFFRDVKKCKHWVPENSCTCLGHGLYFVPYFLNKSEIAVQGAGATVKLHKPWEVQREA